MDLAVVLPIYNEEKTLRPLLQDIHVMLSAMNIQFSIFAVNNRSTDSSESIIKEFVDVVPSIQLIQNNEKGHGPTIMKGYGLAKKYDWVFQFDSDYQYDLVAFKKLWEARHNFDLLIAEREVRSASFARNFITAFLRYSVEMCYGRGIKDINSPFRLMRGSYLQDALRLINARSFAPNTLLSAYFIKKRLRIYKTHCCMRLKAHAKKSNISTNIFIGCFKSIFSLMLFRLKV